MACMKQMHSWTMACKCAPGSRIGPAGHSWLQCYSIAYSEASYVVANVNHGPASMLLC